MTREQASGRSVTDAPPRPQESDPDRIVVAQTHDTRPRARRLAAPLVTLAGTVAAVGYLAVVDPNEPGHYPVCPLKALTGFDCPGCGVLRATHDLAHGDILGALDHNLLVVALVPLAAVLWVRWVMRAWRGVTPAVTLGQFRRRNVLMLTGLVLVLVFGVVRNFVPYLGSGLG